MSRKKIEGGRRIPTAVTLYPGEIEAIKETYGKLGIGNFSSIARYGFSLALKEAKGYPAFMEKEKKDGTVFGKKA